MNLTTNNNTEKYWIPEKEMKKKGKKKEGK